MGSRITYSPIIKAAQYTLLCSTLLFSTSTLSLRYLYSTSRRGQLDTRIFGLVRMWLHDLRLMYKAPGKWRLMHLKHSWSSSLMLEIWTLMQLKLDARPWWTTQRHAAVICSSWDVSYASGQPVPLLEGVAQRPSQVRGQSNFVVPISVPHCWTSSRSCGASQCTFYFSIGIF